jgi:AraC family transcriptional regulator of arabinose operon
MDRRIEAVLTKIANDRACSVQDLASSVNLSPSRLRHLFQQEQGMPLGVFLRRSRLESARTLLEDSFLSVKQVTFEVGYADETHFIREFKSAYGTTPGLYRRLQASGASRGGQQETPTDSQNRQ